MGVSQLLEARARAVPQYTPMAVQHYVDFTDSCFLVYPAVPRQFVCGHFVYDPSSTDISSTDISSTTVYQRTGQLYIQLLFQQIIIFINSNFYLGAIHL